MASHSSWQPRPLALYVLWRRWSTNVCGKRTQCNGRLPRDTDTHLTAATATARKGKDSHRNLNSQLPFYHNIIIASVLMKTISATPSSVLTLWHLSIIHRTEWKTRGQPSETEPQLNGHICETPYFLCFYMKASHTFASTYLRLLSAIDSKDLQEEFIR